MFNGKVLISLSILINSIFIPSIATASVSVIDDEKNKVELVEPAKKIISLAPHITESLFAAGAGGKIIGAVSYSDYPEVAKKIPRVGGYPSLDLEKIISLKPDLVISWSSGNNKKQVDKLRSFGITVFLSEPRYPKDIAKTIQRFGVLAGTSNVAMKATDDFLQHYQSLQKRFSNKKKVKVFYQIWNKPIMTISGGHLISEIIELCGGENVFANLKTLTPRISLESVLASKSEVIISGGMGKARPEWVEEWKPWPELPAVKNGQLYFIDPALMQRVGPRILQGADKLCELLERARTH
ncbi:MAG: cobalamin-binding protein [Gammaproteobacteria bacterium]|nr:cobalamin-binding protein [Gammaproteobacteria bacterium]